MSEEILLLDVASGIAQLTLNEPDRRNPFSPDLVDAFGQRVAEIKARKDIRVVVVTGAGKAFCAGADFATMPTLAARSGLDGILGIHAAIEMLYAAFVSLDSIEVPTIAAVNGAAIGGGFGLALLCDIRIVACDAKLAVNFARLGIHSGLAITDLLPRAVGYSNAADLLLSGRRILGDEAVRMGFAREALPKEEVLPAAMALAGEIAQCAPLAVRSIKRTLRATTGRDLSATMAIESMAQALLMQSKDAQEGIKAMMSKRTPEFEGK
jgi:enoyl-CoA hydratase/carnithine racemase